MSFLDMDERLLELSDRMELVFSPFADPKHFPADVDVTLVEGAVTNNENEHFARTVRERSKLVVAFGDCAVTGNVTAMRNRFAVGDVIDSVYSADGHGPAAKPDDYSCIAKLLPSARPLHEVIPVDAFLHGCPPTADQIWFAVNELLHGRLPVFSTVFLRYG
jgi:NAD-reducing hydrogenase small subunit